MTKPRLGETLLTYFFLFTPSRLRFQLQLVTTLQHANLISLDDYNNFPAKASFVWSAKESFVRDRKMQLNKFFKDLFLANPALVRQPAVLRWAKAPPRVFAEVMVHAAAESDFGTVQLVLNTGVDVNVVSELTGWAALHYAARNGDEQLVRQLLDRSANTNVKVEPRGENTVHSGWTPLCFACANGHHVIAQALLVNHADVNIETADGNNPLTLAIKGQFPAVVRILLSRPELNLAKAFQSEIFNGAHLNALHIAAQLGNASVMKMLIDKGMDVNVVCDPTGCPGWTPLHWAAQTGHEDAVELLLQRGANPTLKTCVKYNMLRTARDTPADIANMFGHEQIARRLMEAADNWRSPTSSTSPDAENNTAVKDKPQHPPESERSLFKLLGVRSTSSESVPDKDKDKKQQSREKRMSRSDRLTAWLMGEDLIEAQKAAAAAAAASNATANSETTDSPAEGASIHAPANDDVDRKSPTIEPALDQSAECQMQLSP